MNNEDFILNKETTVKEILDYALSYCNILSNSFEQDKLCFNCKLNSICGEFIKDWKFPKTYVEDFLEKFPNARVDCGVPVPCIADIYGEDLEACGINHFTDCSECWKQPYKEN